MSIKHEALRILGHAARIATGRLARVVMYHRFGNEPKRNWLTAKQFEAQVRYIKRRFQPCHVSDLARRLREPGPLPSNLVAITVDDGHADFLDVAYPILARYEMPATVYAVSQFTDGNGWLWFDAIHHLVHVAPAGRFQIFLAGRQIEIALDSVANRERAWHTLADVVLKVPASYMPTALQNIQAGLDTVLPLRPTPNYAAMTWDDIQRLDPELVNIGSHTCTHPILTRCTPEQVESEVRGSKVHIEQKLGRPVNAFCYPNGQPADYDEAIALAAKAAGYESAVVAHGTFVGSGSDPYLIERVSPRLELSEFRNMLDGFAYLRDFGGRLRRRPVRSHADVLAVEALPGRDETF